MSRLLPIALLLTLLCQVARADANVPLSAELDDLLYRADEYAASGNLDAAIRSYQELLERNRGALGNLVFAYDHYMNRIWCQLQRIPRQTYEDRYIGVSYACHQRLVALAPRIMERYRAMYDTTAASLLAAAMRMDDPGPALLRLIHDYPLTTAARDAMLVLAEQSIERGEFILARHFLDRLAALPESGDRWRLDLERAIVAAYLGERDVLGPLLERLEVSLAFRDAYPEADTLLSRLSRLANRPERRQIEPNDYLQPFGNSRHNRTSPHGLRFGRRLWTRSDTLLYPLDAPTNKTPSLWPIVAGGNLLVATGRSLHCMSQDDGSDMWVVPLRPIREHLDYAIPEMSYLGATATAEGRVYTNLVLHTEDIRASDTYRHTISIRAQIGYRRLCCFDLRTGKLLWTQDGETDAEFRTGHSAPPVIWRNLVIVSGFRLYGDVNSYVAAFDARTGEQVWETRLCAGTVELTMFGDQAIEPMCEIPAVHNGVVYVSTSLGVFGAVDAMSGQILWLTEYEPQETQAANVYMPTYRNFIWQNTPPMIDGDAVVATPVDSMKAYGFDARTGEVLWELHSQGAYRHLSGVIDGLAVFTGPYDVRAIEIHNHAKLAWPLPDQQELPNGSMVIEPATIAGGEVYVPCQDGIYVFDAHTGQRHSNALAWPPGSNRGRLLVTRDRVYILTASFPRRTLTISAHERERP